MKACLTAIAALSATAVAAHPGHVAPEAGHSHGEVLALIVIAIVAVIAFERTARQ